MHYTLKITAIGILMLGVAACADSRTANRATPPGAADYGAFAYDGGKLQRLGSGSPYATTSPSAWSDRVSLSPGVRFVVQDEALQFGSANLEQRIRLVRVMHARDAAYDVPGERSGGLPQWLVIDAAPTQPVPVRFDSYGPTATDGGTNQYTNMVEVIPEQPLTPGMYALLVEGQQTTQLDRFGVGWAEADRVAFDSGSCVTRVVNADVSYQPCPASVAMIGGTSQVASATTADTMAAARVPGNDGLVLRLLDPVSRTIDGHGNLLVSGEITNTSAGVRYVPLVTVSLKDAAGNLLREWEVMPQDGRLQPGTVTRFDVSVNNPSEGPTTVAATLD